MFYANNTAHPNSWLNTIVNLNKKNQHCSSESSIESPLNKRSAHSGKKGQNKKKLNRVFVEIDAIRCFVRSITKNRSRRLSKQRTCD